MTDRDYTLNWINEQRAEVGKPPISELPKGEPEMAYTCPVAQGLGGEASVGHCAWDWMHSEGSFPLPPRVERFVRAFDKGKGQAHGAIRRERVMGESAIEWTEVVWNPVTGCSKVSPGCAHCYAESVHKARLDGRHGYPTFRPWTPANAEHNVVLRPDRLDQPLRWRKPRMIFVNSMSDLFHERVSDEFIDRVFEVMGKAKQHTFQILTKRPERMLAYFINGASQINRDIESLYPLPNVWLGVSIENRRFVHRADLLRETPAAVRFISAEPLLGPLVPAFHFGAEGTNSAYWPDGSQRPCDPYDGLNLDGIDWLIVGGESGPKARPMDPRWVRDLRDVAAATGTAFFLKQMGGARPGDRLEDLPEDLRIREMPEAVGV